MAIRYSISPAHELINPVNKKIDLGLNFMDVELIELIGQKKLLNSFYICTQHKTYVNLKKLF